MAAICLLSFKAVGGLEWKEAPPPPVFFLPLFFIVSFLPSQWPRRSLMIYLRMNSSNISMQGTCREKKKFITCAYPFRILLGLCLRVLVISVLVSLLLLFLKTLLTGKVGIFSCIDLTFSWKNFYTPLGIIRRWQHVASQWGRPEMLFLPKSRLPVNCDTHMSSQGKPWARVLTHARITQCLPRLTGPVAETAHIVYPFIRQ